MLMSLETIFNKTFTYSILGHFKCSSQTLQLFSHHQAQFLSPNKNATVENNKDI